MFYYGLFMFIIPVLYKGKKLDNEMKYKNSISVGNVCFAVSLWTRKWNLSVTELFCE